MKKIHKAQAFSLVELSIVLVILGLLTGGILSGQSLIRAAELRSVTTEIQNYQSAALTFRDKYFAIPGDMPNATQFWGRLVSSADCVTNSAAVVNAATGVCDGNGNGIINASTAANLSGETFQFWRQLARAGLIEGSYSGLAGNLLGTHSVIGTNVPRSKISNAGWSARHSGVFAGDSVAYALDYANHLDIGTATSNSYTMGAFITPEETWNIDTKVDDGRPAYGKLIARFYGNLASENKCTINATNSSDLDSDYNLQNSTVSCSIHWVRMFY